MLKWKSFCLFTGIGTGTGTGTAAHAHAYSAQHACMQAVYEVCMSIYDFI